MIAAVAEAVKERFAKVYAALWGRPRLRTVLLVMNAVVLALPLGAIFFLRMYENELFRQTQAELLGQGAVIAASFEAELVSLGAAPRKPDPEDKPFREEPAPVNLSRDPVLDPQPPPANATLPPDPLPAAAGKKLAPILRETAKSTLAAIRIVDRQGVVVASSANATSASLAQYEETRRALAGEPVTLLRRRIPEHGKPDLSSLSRGTGLRLYVALPVYAGDAVVGAVLLSRTPRNMPKALYDQLPAALTAGAALFIAVVFPAVVASRLLTRPTAELIRQAEAIAKGRGDAPLKDRPWRPAELMRLSAAMSRMAKEIAKRTRYVRDFALHVSHEFKTPLASLTGAVELLEDHFDSMPAEKRRRFLGNMAADAARLRALTTRLLELARADAPDPAVAATPCRIKPTLLRLADQFRDRGLAVDVEAAPETPAQTGLSVEELESVFANLFDNSRRCGAMRVRVQFGEADGRACATVEDDGPGVSPANADAIFTPFFTTARGTGGTGLGLSIVRSTLENRGGSIRLAPPEPGRGAVFQLTLPPV